MAWQNRARLDRRLTMGVHLTADQFVCRRCRRVGEVLMWDRCATMHRGVGDYRPVGRRIMLRINVDQNRAHAIATVTRVISEARRS